MNKIIIGMSFLIVGCSSIIEEVPSFYDDNESMLAIEVRHKVDALNCKTDYKPQVKDLQTTLRFFELYSESKGSNDVGKMLEAFRESVDDLSEKENNEVFCNIKKRFLEKQSSKIADSIMERF